MRFLSRWSADTDVFCLQEVPDFDDGRAGKWNLEPDMSPDLYHKIKGALPGFLPSLSDAYDDGGNRLAAFVRRELRPATRSTLTVHSAIQVPAGGALYLRSSLMQSVTLSSKGREYSVYNVHGLWQRGKKDTPERVLQSRNIVDSIGGRSRAILCGDFNLDPETESIGILEKAGLRNLIAEFGIKSTRSNRYPAHKPSRFADYVFASREIEVDGFEAVDEEVSDHLPLCLDFD